MVIARDDGYGGKTQILRVTEHRAVDKLRVRFRPGDSQNKNKIAAPRPARNRNRRHDNADADGGGAVDNIGSQRHRGRMHNRNRQRRAEPAPLRLRMHNLQSLLRECLRLRAHRDARVQENNFAVFAAEGQIQTRLFVQHADAETARRRAARRQCQNRAAAWQC